MALKVMTSAEEAGGPSNEEEKNICHTVLFMKMNGPPLAENAKK
jgi:hypothetical protein